MGDEDVVLTLDVAKSTRPFIQGLHPITKKATQCVAYLVSS